jgi:hypothetical protein
VSATGFAQTPLDELLGDSRFSAELRHVLVEFKQSRDRIRTEMSKERRRDLLAALNAPTEEAIRLTATARRCHLLGFGGAEGGIRFGPYKLLMTATARRPVADELSLGEFASALVSGEPARLRTSGSIRDRLPEEVVWRLGVTLGELLDYLRLVLDPTASETLDGSPDVTIAGYWLAVDARGVVSCAAYGNDTQLADLERRGCESLKRQVPKRRILASPPPGPESPRR